MNTEGETVKRTVSGQGPIEKFAGESKQQDGVDEGNTAKKEKKVLRAIGHKNTSRKLGKA